MKKLYVVNMHSELKEFDVLAETEYHWTLESRKRFHIDKSNTRGYALTAEEAWENRIIEVRDIIAIRKEHVEQGIDMLREAEEKYKKFFAEK